MSNAKHDGQKILQFWIDEEDVKSFDESIGRMHYANRADWFRSMMRQTLRAGDALKSEESGFSDLKKGYLSEINSYISADNIPNNVSESTLIKDIKNRTRNEVLKYGVHYGAVLKRHDSGMLTVEVLLKDGSKVDEQVIPPKWYTAGYLHAGEN